MGKLPRRRSLPVSRENSIVLSSPAGLQPRQRRRNQPAQLTPAGAGPRGGGRGGGRAEGGLSYSSPSRGQNENGGERMRVHVPPTRTGRVQTPGGARRGSQSGRCNSLAANPDRPSLDVHANFAPEVHPDVFRCLHLSFELTKGAP